MDVHIPCPCPGAPHPDGDTVTLRDKPTLHMGTTALGWASAQANGSSPTSGDIAELYLREGILSWTFVLDNGSPRPVSADHLDWLLDDYEVAFPVAEQASDLYTEVIFRPLVAQLPKSSRTGQTNGSTSRRSVSSSSRRSRSAPSPIATSEAS
jgi:hypothetical protein